MTISRLAVSASLRYQIDHGMGVEVRPGIRQPPEGGNYTVGIREQVIFPEIEFDKVDSVHGLDIVIVTTAKTDEEGRALLGHLGMPYRK